VTQLDARYYRRNSENRLLSVSLSALATHELDPDMQVLLGGDNGLRGYPIRYQAGENRALFTVEQRFYTDFYPWRLFRFGYAAFFDAGRVTGRDPRASVPLAAREPRPDPAHRSRVPDQPAAGDRQGAADRRDEGNVLTFGRSG